jgi:hypothetical protein
LEQIVVIKAQPLVLQAKVPQVSVLEQLKKVRGAKSEQQIQVVDAIYIKILKK